jgi:hypothetical protein
LHAHIGLYPQRDIRILDPDLDIGDCHDAVAADTEDVEGEQSSSDE